MTETLPSWIKLASHIDQTLLSPQVGMCEAQTWMEESAKYGFASLCVAPWLVPMAYQALIGVDTAVCTVVGFPLGITDTVAKAAETARAIDLGATEIDMVINIGALLEGDDIYVYREIAEIVRIAEKVGGDEVLVKAILETGYLDPARIAIACELASHAGVAFVKTSTGLGPRGASVEDVRLMRESVPSEVGVKASGGIRDLATALAMIEAGATRIGTSSGLAILAELPDFPA